MSDLKNTIESLLFSSGKKITLEELSKLTRERDFEAIRKALAELKHELESKEGSITLEQEGDSWKLGVKEKYLSYVKKIVSQTELRKGVLETLGVVSYKSPVMQSEIIKVRTNKAYDHLNELEESGFITRERKGRSKLIKLTQKFFDYFDISPAKLKEKFSSAGQLEKALEQKEHAHIESDKPEPHIDLVKDGKTEHLQNYEGGVEIAKEPLPSPVEIVREKLGALEVYNPPKQKKKRMEAVQQTEQKIEEKTAEITAETTQAESPIIPIIEKPQEEKAKRITAEQVKTEAKKAAESAPERKGRGLYPQGMPESVSKRVDERVEEIVKGEKTEESQFEEHGSTESEEAAKESEETEESETNEEEK